jgi:hypothetical protein
MAQGLDIDECLVEHTRGVIHAFLCMMPPVRLQAVDPVVVSALVNDTIEGALATFHPGEMISLEDAEELRVLVADEVLLGLIKLYVGKAEAA